MAKRSMTVFVRKQCKQQDTAIDDPVIRLTKYVNLTGGVCTTSFRNARKTNVVITTGNKFVCFACV